MDTINQQMAQRVWQRVRGESEKADLSGLLFSEYQAAADYQHLQSRLPGKAAVFRQLSEESRRHCACLSGIRFLQGTGVKKPTLPKAKQEQSGPILRRCCGQCMRAAQGYQTYTNDPEYGSVFAALAQEKQHQLRLLLEILGEPTESK